MWLIAICIDEHGCSSNVKLRLASIDISLMAETFASPSNTMQQPSSVSQLQQLVCKILIFFPQQSWVERTNIQQGFLPCCLIVAIHRLA
jgi:hypothetical protein